MKTKLALLAATLWTAATASAATAPACVTPGVPLTIAGSVFAQNRVVLRGAEIVFSVGAQETFSLRYEFDRWCLRDPEAEPRIKCFGPGARVSVPLQGEIASFVRLELSGRNVIAREAIAGFPTGRLIQIRENSTTSETVRFEAASRLCADSTKPECRGGQLTIALNSRTFAPSVSARANMAPLDLALGGSWSQQTCDRALKRNPDPQRGGPYDFGT